MSRGNVRNIRIALMVIFKEHKPPVIAAMFGINVSRVYQITDVIKKRFGYLDGMHPNDFSALLARGDLQHNDRAGAYKQQTPAHIYHTIREEEGWRVDDTRIRHARGGLLF